MDMNEWIEQTNFGVEVGQKSEIQIYLLQRIITYIYTKTIHSNAAANFEVDVSQKSVFQN